ncbi:MAG: tryptophan--tRNA ligase, partial [Bacteroidetes bacterium]
VTDDKSLEEPKDPDNSIIIDLYGLIGPEEQTNSLKDKYRAGNFGYGHAKQELFELIMDTFSNQRSEFNRYMADKGLMDEVLQKGAEKAAVVANETLLRVRDKLGYNYKS